MSDKRGESARLAWVVRTEVELEFTAVSHTNKVWDQGGIITAHGKQSLLCEAASTPESLSFQVIALVFSHFLRRTSPQSVNFII